MAFFLLHNYMDSIAINITMTTNKLMFEFLNFNFTKKFISFNSITSLKIYH